MPGPSDLRRRAAIPELQSEVRTEILDALRAAGKNRDAAAVRLGIASRTLYDLIAAVPGLKEEVASLGRAEPWVPPEGLSRGAKIKLGQAKARCERGEITRQRLGQLRQQIVAEDRAART